MRNSLAWIIYCWRIANSQYEVQKLSGKCRELCVALNLSSSWAPRYLAIKKSKSGQISAEKLYSPYNSIRPIINTKKT